jgi:predicted transcriptional regulator YheO
MIGAFCVNFDTTPFEHFEHFLKGLTQCEDDQIVGEGELSPILTLEEEVHQHIQDFLSKYHLQLSQLSYADKQMIVAYLDQRGCFRQKGAMTVIAKALQLTRQSIYNYLKMNKEKQV